MEHRPTLVLEKLSIETRERRSLSFQKNVYEHRPHQRKPKREARPAPEPRQSPEPRAEINDVKEELTRVKALTQSHSRGIHKLKSENFDLRIVLDDLKAQFARGTPRGAPAPSPLQASVILQEEAMLHAQLKRLDDKEEKGRRERPRQQEQRKPQREPEKKDDDDSSQDGGDISARLLQALMRHEGRG